MRQTGARSPERYGTNTGRLGSGSDRRGESEHLGGVAAQQPGEPLDRGAARLGRPVVDGEGCARRRAARVAADAAGSARDELTPTMLEVPERTKADGLLEGADGEHRRRGVAPADRDRYPLGKAERGGGLRR